jgi:hypothetical protein
MNISYILNNKTSIKCMNIHQIINPLNAELNPICHLLALVGVHHILHVSRINVKVKLVLGETRRVKTGREVRAESCLV